ncbi:MAG TPA: VWA-like domain-containing protein, partial [Ramlibacter sp.]|nr:VWA-like domain-containing protein [Ramlibacter sp.]
PTETARARISKARAALILSQPFWAALALRLDVQPMPANVACSTMATDGKYLWFNADFVLDQKPEHLVTIVAHEAGHCALQHPMRRQGRDPARSNIAEDHAVNLLLKGSGFPMPKGAYCDPQYTDWAFERIYPLIPEQPPARGGNYGGMGCVVDASGDGGQALSQADREAMEREWKIALIQAAQAAKAQGKLPGCLEGLIESVRAPAVDWRAVLREFVRSVAANDYSWRRANPRFLATGDYLPSLWSEEIGPLAIGVDTSGSVSQAELEAVCSELNGILDTVKPEFVAVAYADARVHSHEVFKPDDWPVKMAVQGRGGTDLRGLWPYFDKHDITPCCAIVCTDMELRVADLGEEPPYPVLICTTGRMEPMDGPVAFGQVIKVELSP